MLTAAAGVELGIAALNLDTGRVVHMMTVARLTFLRSL